MTSVTIPLSELPGRLTEALDLVRAGMEVMVQDAAGPLARLIPAGPLENRQWVFNIHPGAMVMREDFDDYINEEGFLKGAT